MDTAGDVDRKQRPRRAAEGGEHGKPVCSNGRAEREAEDGVDEQVELVIELRRLLRQLLEHAHVGALALLQKALVEAFLRRTRVVHLRLVSL